MAAFEDSFKSLLQGVSQQLPKDRLDGQLSAQENMLSDPVTNLRRRPGAKHAFSYQSGSASWNNLRAWATSIGDLECHLILNTTTGLVLLVQYNEAADTYSGIQTFAYDYLKATDPQSIYIASVGTELYMVNTEQVVQKGPVSVFANPNYRGYFDVIAGAFSKKYEVTVTNRNGDSFTASYTTPNGSAAGDAALATPQYIAATLGNQILQAANFGTAGTPAGTMGAYADAALGTVYLQDGGVGLGKVSVRTSSGRTFITASGQSYITDSSTLPAQMPQTGVTSLAEAYVVATGSASAPVYYKWQNSTRSWLEAGEPNSSALYLNNTPVVLRRGTSSEPYPVIATQPDWEGRFAGDDFTNPDPAFVGKAITGVSTFEGRLVLMVGNTIMMSASGKPRRWYRSTVTALIDSDVISVSATAAQSAQWRQAVQYDKDLLLFSERYQGVVAGGSQAVTPRTAALRVLSSYAGDVTAPPVSIGRTVMFPKPVSLNYFGLMEMVASQYADSSYTSYESTLHLPEYMAGRCRLAVASSSSTIAAFLSTTEHNTVVVHEYTWQGDNKVQQAWHKWTFPQEVAAMYFSGSRLHLVDRKSVV